MLEKRQSVVDRCTKIAESDDNLLACFLPSFLQLPEQVDQFLGKVV